jgi:TonB family protein
MSRDAQIPLFLWIATAVVAHLLWGGGADRVARIAEERLEIRDFAASVRRFVRGDSKPIEIALLDEQNAEDKPTPDAPVDPEQREAEPDDESASHDEAPPADPKRTPPEDKKPPEEKKPEEKKPLEPEKKVEPVEKVEEVPPPPPPEEDKKRIAIRQNVEDPKQADNPDANFIADQANRVKEETQAKITGAEQNDPKPTPGGAPTKSADPNDPGNSEETRVAQNEDRAGEKDRAPGVKPAPSELRIAQVPSPAASPAAGGVERSQDGHAKGDRSANSEARQPGQEGALAQPTLNEAEATPDALASSKGSWEIGREQSASNEQAGRQARKKRALPPMRSSGSADLLGLGAAGLTPGGVNLNLSPQIAVAAIGRDQLSRELRADGERRRSQHAGKWRPVGIERWRSAIENYVPMVKPGNQTALNSARSPFGSYLNQVHQRIHPIFADAFLGSLGDLPSSHPMNRPDLSTNLEIVLDRDEGRVQRLGVTKTSGVTAFDVAALEAVHRAQPFGTPPREIVSPDGNVYFHWEFHRNRDEACSTWFARPYILKGQPKSAPPPTPEPSQPPESETPARHGKHTPKARPGSDSPAMRSTLALSDAPR